MFYWNQNKFQLRCGFFSQLLTKFATLKHKNHFQLSCTPEYFEVLLSDFMTKWQSHIIIMYLQYTRKLEDLITVWLSHNLLSKQNEFSKSLFYIEQWHGSGIMIILNDLSFILNFTVCALTSEKHSNIFVFFYLSILQPQPKSVWENINLSWTCYFYVILKMRIYLF